MLIEKQSKLFALQMCASQNHQKQKELLFSHVNFMQNMGPQTEQPSMVHFNENPAFEHQEKERKIDNDAIVHIPVTETIIIRDNISQSNYSQTENAPEEIGFKSCSTRNLLQEDSMNNNNFETEKNVRKAIENLEILTSKVAKDQISRSLIITSILD